jgi:signal transduction histidine kinase/DNA-binding response OmpR family regulator
VLRTSLLLLLFLSNSKALCTNQYSEIGMPVTQTFGLAEHKGSDQNWYLTQADNGLIYSGTGTGIIEWDGENWHLYNTPNNSRVRSLIHWHDGHIYAGTIDDIGVFKPNTHGTLEFISLVSQWSAQERQFGEVWSTAANSQGVMFVTNKAMYFWDGNKVHKVPDMPGGTHRIFTLDDSFVFKILNEKSLHILNINTSSLSPDFTLNKSDVGLPKTAVIRNMFYNNSNELVTITGTHGIFEQHNGTFELRLDGTRFGVDDGLYEGIQAKDGFYYLVSLDRGLFVLDPTYHIVANYREEHNLGIGSLYSVLEDQQSNIWLSGIPSITQMLPPHRLSSYKPGTQSTIIDRLVPVGGKLVATGDGVFQLKAGQSQLAPAKFEVLIDSKRIYFDAIEYKKHFLYAGNGGVFARLINEPEQEFSNILKTGWARSLKVDPLTNKLVVSSYEGLFIVEYLDGEWSKSKVEGLADELEFVAVQDNGVIWTGTTTQELYRVENAQFLDKATKVEKFVDKDGLGPGNVMPFKLSSGVVIATSNGLMDYMPQRLPALQFMTGFPEIFTTEKEDVFRIFEDPKGRVWFRIGQQSGYVEKDRNGKWQRHSELFAPFTKVGLRDFASDSTEHVWFVQSSGEVYRANVDLAEALPSEGKLNIRRISNLDSQVMINGGQLSATDPIALDQTNNSIRIEFALSGSSLLNDTLYRHRLLGSGQQKWSEWANEHQKDYTLLSGGDYQFQVQAKDDWLRTYETELAFYVKPPWYLSRIAWVAYILVLITLLVLTGLLTQHWRAAELKAQNRSLESTVALRTQEIKDKVAELEQQQVLKERFFANVSHEFRTPLTLTIAPLKDLLAEYPNLKQGISYPVETALRNANKMLELVGHILDINRLDAGQFPMHIAQYDIAELINLVAPRFKGWAHKQHQTITIHDTNDPVLLYFDRDQLEKCIANLLSNAIKYSGSNTQISISILKQTSRIGIEVKDNGTGVEHSLHEKLFDRFYQGESSQNVNQPGTGIGLALVKELMELHHGEIELVSQVGQGCCFTIWLKPGNQHFDASLLLENSVSNSVSDMPIFPIAQIPDRDMSNMISSDTLTHSKDDITTILVVDDNVELRQFISLKLSGYYRIVQACDGEEGLEKAISTLPDLIISDVMMPKMNGLEMLAELRKNALICTVPIIMLSAKSGKRETVEGLQTGADDYMTKPFDTSELIARIDGLIRNRKMIREQLKTDFALSLNAHSIADKNEPSFAEKLRFEILQNLTNPEFNTDILAAAMALSRRSLSRKCQEDCQQSAGQFITQVRMQIALKLINENTLSISEIAYGTGYESLAYFSRTFKKFYGKAPTAIKSLKTN